MSTFDKLDAWVKSRGSGKYHVEGADVSTPTPIQQVREEVFDLVDVIEIDLYRRLCGPIHRRLPDGHQIHANVLEIGLGQFGGTNILWGLLFSGKIVTIESNQEFITRFQEREKCAGRVFVPRNSLECATAEIVQQWAPYALLHIDGDHGYEAVFRDYEHYAPMVKPGGMIVMHDLLTEGVSKFVENLENAGHEINRIVHSKHVGTAWEVKR